MTEPRRPPLPPDEALDAPEPSAPELSPAEAEALVAALRGAWTPGAPRAEVERALRELALEDPLSPPTAAEVAAAGALAGALADALADADAARSAPPELALALALRCAVHPPPLPPAAAARALASAPLVATPPRSRTGRLVLVAFGATGALAAAAAVALALGAWSATPSRPLPHASRSTTGLFVEHFTVGGATERIDRIASVRSRELRDNRFAAWGVR